MFHKNEKYIKIESRKCAIRQKINKNAIDIDKNV